VPRIFGPVVFFLHSGYYAGMLGPDVRWRALKVTTVTLVVRFDLAQPLLSSWCLVIKGAWAQLVRHRVIRRTYCIRIMLQPFFFLFSNRRWVSCVLTGVATTPGPRPVAGAPVHVSRPFYLVELL